MKKLLLGILIGSFGISNTNAQLTLNGHFYGEDALKFYTSNNSGSAKVQGMGGAFTALGGDMSNAFLNPAGLGYYNKSEFSFSPVFVNQTTNSNYLGENNTLSSSGLKLGQLGAIFSSNGVGTRKKRSAWGITYNTLANFNNSFTYSGSNKRSSLTDYYAEKATQRGVSSTALNEEFNTQTGQTQTSTAMYYQAFLIDPVDGGGYRASELSIPVAQNGRVSESGALSQINVSYGANFDDRTYVGASLGIQNLNYAQLTDHTENFPNGEIFNSFRNSDDLYVKGSGINLSVGAIFKVSNNVNIGANLTSPTAMKVNETFQSTVTINQKPNTFTTDYPTISTVPNDFTYRITSPLKANVGAAVFLPNKIGVVNIETEYIGYSRMNVKDKQDQRWSSDQKQGIQNQFKDVINLKAGAELRFGIARVRGGVNYLGDPIRVSNDFNTGNALVGSLGAGVKTAKFYGDVSYSRSKTSAAYTPYTLSNTADYSSVGYDKKQGIVAISLGTYF
jgi:hypothetical protein